MTPGYTPEDQIDKEPNKLGRMLDVFARGFEAIFRNRPGYPDDAPSLATGGTVIHGVVTPPPPQEPAAPSEKKVCCYRFKFVGSVYIYGTKWALPPGLYCEIEGDWVASCLCEKEDDCKETGPDGKLTDDGMSGKKFLITWEYCEKDDPCGPEVIPQRECHKSDGGELEWEECLVPYGTDPVPEFFEGTAWPPNGLCDQCDIPSEPNPADPPIPPLIPDGRLSGEKEIQCAWDCLKPCLKALETKKTTDDCDEKALRERTDAIISNIMKGIMGDLAPKDELCAE